MGEYHGSLCPEGLMDRINVLVTGVGGNVGQGIIKALRLSKLNLQIIGADASPFSPGLYRADKAYLVPRAGEKNYLSDMIRICKAESVHCVMLGPDQELLTMAQNKEIIEKDTGAKVIISSVAVVETSNDKWLTYLFLHEANLNYPSSFIPTSPEENLVQAETIGYPLIVKPRVGFGSKDIFVVQKKEELNPIIRRVYNPIIQEYLMPDDEEYTSEVFTLADGSQLGTITMKRRLLRGTSVVAICDDYPEIRDQAQKTAKALKPYGPCNFQMRLTRHGPVVFEINARFSGTTVARAKFGFNSPENALRHFVVGEKLNPPKIEKGVMLRYWEEIYLQEEHLKLLQKDKMIEGRIACKPDYF